MFNDAVQYASLVPLFRSAFIGGSQFWILPEPSLLWVWDRVVVSRGDVFGALIRCQPSRTFPSLGIVPWQPQGSMMSRKVRSAPSCLRTGRCSSTDGLQAPATKTCDAVLKGVHASVAEVVLSEEGPCPQPSIAICRNQFASLIVDWCTAMWQSWVRSFVLLQLIALIRLLIIGFLCNSSRPCRRERSKIARCIHTALKGAPCALALCVCIPVAGAMPAPGSVHPLHTAPFDAPHCLPTLNLWSPLTADFVFQGRPLDGDVTLDVEGTVPLVPNVGPPADNMRFVSEILHFQRSSSFAFHHTGAVHDVDSLADEVLEQIALDATDERLIAVHPQPCTDRPVFIASHIRHDITDDVPVCVEVEVRGSRSIFWMDFVPTHCSYSEARDLLGELFWPGMVLRVGESSGPLFEDDSCMVRPGMLVRFTLAGRSPRASVALEALMRNPTDVFADIDEEGAPEYFAAPGASCVLQSMTPPTVLTVRRHATLNEVVDTVSRRIATPPAGFTVTAPRARIFDVFLRGSGVERVIGVKSQSTEAPVGVFVDARDLAVPVKLVQLPPRVWTASEIAAAVGIHCKAPIQVTNSRGGRATSAQGRITVCDADVLTFSCLLYPDTGERSDDDVGSRSLHVAGRPHHGASSVPGHLSGCPSHARLTSAGDTPSADRPDHIANSQQRGNRTADSQMTCASAGCSSNAGFITTDSEALSCRGPSVSGLALRGPEECSSEARHVPPGADRSVDQSPGPDVPMLLASDFTARHEMAVGEVHVPVVFDGPEALPHVDLTTGLDSDVEGASPAHDESAQATESEAETEWRILCAVHAFQRRPRYCTLFVARDENIMAVLERAHIILLPPDGSLKIVLVDPSPFRRMLTFIAYPAWWTAADVRPFLLSWTGDGIPPFVEIGRQGSVFSDFLPGVVPEAGSTVDVFTNVGSQPLQPSDSFVPQAGALVMTMPSRDGDPDVVHAQAVVNDHANAFEPGDQYPQCLNGSDHTLLLGVMFEQFLVKSEGEASEAELSAAYNVPPADAVFYYPSAPFDDVAFQGVPVQRIAAVRRRSLHGRTLRGEGVFIDPRDLGQPVCFRLFHSREVTTEMLLRAVDVELPDGVEAMIEGPRVVGNVLHISGNNTIVSICAGFASAGPCPEISSDSPAPLDDEDETTDGPAPDDACSTGSRTNGVRSRRSRSPPPRSTVDKGTVNQSSDGALRALLQAIATPMRASCPRQDADGGLGARENSIACSLDPLFRHPPLISSCPGALCVTQQGELHLKDVVALVETEMMRAAGVKATPSSEEGKSGILLRLSDLVVPPAVACDKQCVHLVSERVSKWWSLLAEPWQDFSLAFNGADVCFHESTCAALALAWPPEDMPEIRHLHIYTDGSAKDGEAGWAAVVVQWDAPSSSVAFLGAFGGHVELNEHRPEFVGATAKDARSAELSALMWSLLWLIGHWTSFCVCTATLHFDSTTAGFAASGTWSTGTDSLAQKTRHLAQACEACSQMGPIYWRHIKAHCGHPWNESADTVAEAMRLGAAPTISRPCLPSRVELGSADISKLYLAVPSWDACAFPQIRDGVANWREEEQGLTVMSPEQVVPFAWNEHASSWCMDFRCVTVNVQSAVGKHSYLEQQFEEGHLAIAFLQEMKETAGLIKSSRYLRFGTDSETHWGVAIWISRRIPLGWIAHTPVFADESSINVISSGPRHLVLNITAMGERICLTSVHFPHQGRPEEERASLMETLDVAWKQAQHSLLVLGCDANGRIPTWYRNVTGDRLVGDPDDPGFALCELAALHDCWLPSTFSACHSGCDFTHVHTKGKPSRIDYFATSASLPSHQIQTWVDKSIDLLNAQEDHFALVMRMQMVRCGRDSDAIRCKKKNKYDLRKLRVPEVRDRIHRRLSDLTLPAWEVDVNAHANLFQQQVSYILDEEIPLRADAPRSWYLTDQAWDLRQQKHCLRRRTSNRRKDQRFVIGSLVFDIWTPPTGTSVAGLRALLRKVCVLYDVIAGAINWATARLRAIVRADKAQHLASLAASFGTCAPQEIMMRLRQMQLGRKKLKTWRAQLPGLIKPDGTRTLDRVDVDQVWLEYFNGLEAGEILPLRDFLASSARLKHPPDLAMDADVFPDRLEIEQCLREVKPRKAAGLDSLPGDVLRIAAGPFARLLEPLFFKSIAYMRQPVQWRGGILVAAWKGSGPTEQVSSYRSLFVGSAVGKTYHRLIRNKVAKHVDQYLGPCHFGARRGSPVTHASHLVLAHEQWARKEGRSSSALFLDTRSAYYRVVREAATGMREPQDMDACVMKVLQHFAMPPDTWGTLLQLVADGGALFDAGASKHLCAVAADLHDDAFFVTQYASRERVSRTRAGSRPGESMADVIFSVIYHQVLCQIRKEADVQGLVEPLDYDGLPSLWVGDPVEKIWMMDSTWADDTAFVTQAAEPAELLRRTSQLAAKVVDASRRHALDPNLKRGKTEVMVSLRGQGCRKVALQWFGQDGAVLRLHTQLAGEVLLNVVASYVHLGFQIDRGATFKPEALRRLSQAAAACREIRDVVLQNVHIPRPTRAQLFSALVEATFFNLELWQQDVGSAWEKIVVGHSRLQRSILSRELPAFGAHEAHAG